MPTNLSGNPEDARVFNEFAQTAIHTGMESDSPTFRLWAGQLAEDVGANWSYTKFQITESLKSQSWSRIGTLARLRSLGEILLHYQFIRGSGDVATTADDHLPVAFREVFGLMPEGFMLESLVAVQEATAALPLEVQEIINKHVTLIDHTAEDSLV